MSSRRRPVASAVKNITRPPVIAFVVSRVQTLRVNAMPYSKIIINALIIVLDRFF
jgi:hypothetical protein